MRNKKQILIRPICPGDEPLMVKFHQTLSEQSVYQRYFNVLKLSQRTAHERLMRICVSDDERELALVAEYQESPAAQKQILGVGRLSRRPGGEEGEFAILIGDVWQGLGLGAELLRRLLRAGREEKLRRVIGYILRDNRVMRRICQKAGFKIRPSAYPDDLRAEYTF